LEDFLKMQEQILLSRRDAAMALGVSLRTIDYLISRGELRARPIGRRKMVARVELERFATRGGAAAKRNGTNQKDKKDS
jgi:excisionase family DNA binding protein